MTDSPRPDGPPARITYWDYLRIDDLLALQGGVEGDERLTSRHEALFIVVHQVFELWFKLVLRELAFVRETFDAPRVPEPSVVHAVHALRRVQTILDVGAQHWKVMETLSPHDFLAFREKLFPASGFQSGQFREVEAVLGLDESKRIGFGGVGSHVRALRAYDGTPSGSAERLAARIAAGRSIREGLDDWLHRTPIRGSVPGAPGDAEAVAAFAADFLDAMRRDLGDPEERAARQAIDADDRAKIAGAHRAALASAADFLAASDVPDADARARRARIRCAILFIETYRDAPLLAWPRDLLDALVATEQSLLIFRQRHARMVEREIGNRMGTGGSAGVAYLDATALKYRVFTDLWAIRTILLRPEAVPPLPDRERYGFHE